MPLLSEVKNRASKAREKSYEVWDDRGLFMLVTPTGVRLWQFKYRIDGVEKLLALGAYPDVPLKRAGETRDEARTLVADGVGPTAKRRADRAQS